VCLSLQHTDMGKRAKIRTLSRVSFSICINADSEIFLLKSRTRRVIVGKQKEFRGYLILSTSVNLEVIMSKHLFLKALASLGVAVCAAAPVSANPLMLLGIQAPEAGTKVGTDALQRGTLQYTNSTGSNDNFAVGTSTSISASASASSTPDYSVNSNANFALGGASTINQVIGTSSSNNSSNSSSMSLEQAASASASQSTSQSVEQNYKTSHNGQSGWWWWGNNQWNSTSEQEYTQKRESSYQSAYESAYSKAFSSLTESAAARGTISGTFTKDAGIIETSTAVVDGANVNTVDQVKAATNDVVVKGIGATSNVQASTSAAFSTEISKADGASSTGAGTGSGSAAGSVVTNASASAASSSFVSSFVQAY